MVKGNHSQGNGKTKQRKGRREPRSSAGGLQVKGTLPTRHRALGIGNLKQHIWGKEMVENLERGRIIFRHDWNNFCPSLITTVCSKFHSRIQCPQTLREAPLSAMAFNKQWAQLANSHPLKLIFLTSSSLGWHRRREDEWRRNGVLLTGSFPPS